jgi:hypothetical protein
MEYFSLEESLKAAVGEKSDVAMKDRVNPSRSDGMMDDLVNGKERKLVDGDRIPVLIRIPVSASLVDGLNA